MRINNTHFSLSPVERQMGRVMRAPDGHGDSGVGDNMDDGTGNSGDSGNRQDGVDNNGQSNQLEQFWNDPEPVGDNSNSGGSNSDSDSSGDDSSSFGAQIMQGIQNYELPDIFTDSIAQEIADGNFENLNKSIQTQMRGVMQQSIVTAAQIMKRFEESMNARMDGMIQNNNTQNADTELLKKEFESYSNPQTRPIITNVFNQALKHTKGDRTEAIKMTRSMLQAMGQNKDFSVANQNSDDGIPNEQSSKDLVAELLEFKN